jgi:hypothetical protein
VLEQEQLAAGLEDAAGLVEQLLPRPARGDLVDAEPDDDGVAARVGQRDGAVGGGQHAERRAARGRLQLVQLADVGFRRWGFRRPLRIVPAIDRPEGRVGQHLAQQVAGAPRPDVQIRDRDVPVDGAHPQQPPHVARRGRAVHPEDAQQREGEHRQPTRGERARHRQQRPHAQRQPRRRQRRGDRQSDHQRA